MLSFTYAELSTVLAAFAWPFARIAATVASAPILGNPGIPRRVRLLLALAITAVVAPLAGPMPALEPWSGAGLLILAQQVVIGTAMGLAVRLVFTMVDVAGEIAGLQMGLGFATFFDPLHGTHVPVVAQFLGLLTSLVFLGINGHVLVVSVLAESFQSLPVGASPVAEGWVTLAEWGGRVFASGLLLAMPVIAALLVTNVALGILTRAAPQLNLFALGFPVTILVGWVVLALTLPLLAPLLVRVLEDGLRMMLEVTTLVAPLAR